MEIVAKLNPNNRGHLNLMKPNRTFEEDSVRVEIEDDALALAEERKRERGKLIPKRVMGMIHLWDSLHAHMREAMMSTTFIF